MEKMNIGVLGVGYVGLTSAVCFAKFGHKIHCYDIDPKRVEKLQKGTPIIYEVGLPTLLKQGLKKKKLVFTNSLEDTLKNSEVIFITVGTPQTKIGKADLTYYWSAINNIVKTLKKMQKNGYKFKEKIIVDKSTLPAGTAREAFKIFKKNFGSKVRIAVNPEFLREGTGINDFLYPDRIVVGAGEKRIADKVLSLYKIKGKKLTGNLEEAELIKYASNSFLATKISFINEMSMFAGAFDADVRKIAEGMGWDSRIGHKFLQAGIGYGGSCFPKDVQALIYLGKKKKLKLNVLPSAEKTNFEMKKKALEILKKEMKLKGKTIALLGLAFKHGTDDMREASSITLVKGLLKEKAKVRAFDPQAFEQAKMYFGGKIHYAKNINDCLKGADVLVLVTEWPEFKKLNLKNSRKLMKGNFLLDGRNFFDKDKVIKAGFKYKGIGVN